MDPNYKPPSSLDLAKLPPRKPSHELAWTLMSPPPRGSPLVTHIGKHLVGDLSFRLFPNLTF